MVQDSTEQTYKRRRLRNRDVTAPDAEEADEEGAAARIDSSCCIHDDVNSDGNTSHGARTRTAGRRTLGQGDAPGSRWDCCCLFIYVYFLVIVFCSTIILDIAIIFII